MTTKRQPKCQPVDKSRGVWRLPDRPGRPNPFGVQWSEKSWDDRLGCEVRKRPAEFFPTEAEREKRYAEIAEGKKLGKPSTASRADLRQWEAFQTAAAGVPWQQILSGYHTSLKTSSHKPCTDTIKSWSVDYLAECKAKVSRNEMGKDTFSHKENAIRELTARFGHLPLDRPNPAMIEKMIDDIGRGHPPTFNGWRRMYFAFFNRAVELKKIRENPIAGIKIRRFHVDNRDRILTPQDTAKLFSFTMDHPVFKKIIGRLALEFFLGVRFSSSYRSSKKNINPVERTVILPASELKTGKESGISHMVDTNNFPGLETLWEWLAITPDECWSLKHSQYMKLKSAVFIAAGVPHPRNCARKSFASYDLAAHRTPSRTAYILGHTDQEELWEDYKTNATQLLGILYQAISPSTCREIALTGRLPNLNQRHITPAPMGVS